MRIITKENVHLINESSQVLYSIGASHLKLQKFTDESWGFANLSFPRNRITKHNTEVSDKWPTSDFSSPKKAVESVLIKSPSTIIWEFNNLNELCEFILGKS